MRYHVLCPRPGLRRGGRENPDHASYVLGDHTPAQLRSMLDDPAIRIVVGDVLTEAAIAAMEAPASPAEKTGKARS